MSMSKNLNPHLPVGKFNILFRFPTFLDLFYYRHPILPKAIPAHQPPAYLQVLLDIMPRMTFNPLTIHFFSSEDFPYGFTFCHNLQKYAFMLSYSWHRITHPSIKRAFWNESTMTFEVLPRISSRILNKISYAWTLLASFLRLFVFFYVLKLLEILFVAFPLNLFDSGLENHDQRSLAFKKPCPYLV